MKRYIFTKDKWCADGLIYTYSPVAHSYNEFIQEESYICLGYDPKIKKYDHTELSREDICGEGSSLSVKCSFEGNGAPLIIISDDRYTDEDGRIKYGVNYELVVYSGGCNVWRVIPDDENEARHFRSIPVLRESFELKENEIVHLKVTVVGKKAEIDLNERHFAADLSELGDNFYMGFAGCEGVCRFYEAVFD